MDYSLIDNSSLLQFLFYPRPEHSDPPENAFDMMVPVEEGVEVHCRGYWAQEDSPWLLYFHGNGEVVSDYDFFAPYYREAGLNLLVADYRGYGKSTGSPTFGRIVADAPMILEAAEKELTRRELLQDRLWVMGRSLGSICALELADRCAHQLQGLIIESGFLSIVRLIRHLGLPSPGDLNELEAEARKKVSRITLPTLVIHGERDQLVPLEQGEELYRALASEQKKLFTIPLADHNNIFFVETENYLEEIRKMVLGGKNR